jgi:hypothetical protein
VTANRTPLRAESAEKLAAAVEAADDMVDGGLSPEAALAKAARDNAVPVGHVPFLVRAFNTGRAVRQFGAGDPWEKAAAHPVATVEGVRRILDAPETVKAAAADDRTADYFVPPPEPTPTHYFPFLTPEQRKEAAARVRREEAPAPPPEPAPDDRYKLAFAAIDAMIALTDGLKAASPAQYLAIKEAAASVAPAAAAYAFAYAEANDVWLRQKAASAARPDPTVTTRHPVVDAVRRLAAARSAFPKEAAAPAGYAPVENYGVPVAGWYAKAADAQLTIFGTPVSPPPAAEPVKAAGLFDRQSHDTKSANFFKDFAGGTKSVFSGLGGSIMSRKLPQQVYADMRVTRAKDPVATATGDLPDTLARVDEHAAIQSILADPRFVKADPHTLVQAYRNLSNVAPTAMQNPDIAADYLTRRIQTGPLGYHDLEALTRIEKNMADYHRRRPEVDDED